MEKSIEFILDDKLTLGIAIYGYSLGWGGGGALLAAKPPENFAFLILKIP